MKWVKELNSWKYFTRYNCFMQSDYFITKGPVISNQDVSNRDFSERFLEPADKNGPLKISPIAFLDFYLWNR